MRKVKQQLSGKKSYAYGVNEKGQPRTLYITDEVSGLLHLNLEGKELFVHRNELLDAICLAIYGEEYQQKKKELQNARHARKEKDVAL